MRCPRRQARTCQARRRRSEQPNSLDSVTRSTTATTSPVDLCCATKSTIFWLNMPRALMCARAFSRFGVCGSRRAPMATWQWNRSSGTAASSRPRNSSSFGVMKGLALNRLAAPIPDLDFATRPRTTAANAITSSTIQMFPSARVPLRQASRSSPQTEQLTPERSPNFGRGRPKSHVAKGAVP